MLGFPRGKGSPRYHKKKKTTKDRAKKTLKQGKHYLPLPKESDKKTGRILSKNGRSEMIAENGRDGISNLFCWGQYRHCISGLVLLLRGGFSTSELFPFNFAYEWRSQSRAALGSRMWEAVRVGRVSAVLAVKQHGGRLDRRDHRTQNQTKTSEAIWQEKYENSLPGSWKFQCLFSHLLIFIVAFFQRSLHAEHLDAEKKKMLLNNKGWFRRGFFKVCCCLLFCFQSETICFPWRNTLLD